MGMEQRQAVIVGGGASGLMAAVQLARLGVRDVLLLERGRRVGKKLLATGNGTCNLTNMGVAPVHYHGAGAPAFVVPALEAFGPRETLDFFASIGLDCVVRSSGKVYPLSEQAAAVLDCLRLEARALGVEERCDWEVSSIRRETGGGAGRLCLEGNAGIVRTPVVLVCTGGAAAPALGGGTSGYGLLTALGHTRTPLFPSIVQVRTETSFVRSLKGIRTEATVRFVWNGTSVGEETGEVLFTEYGLSDPAVMQSSRPVADWERRRSGTMTARLDLLPGMEAEAVRRNLLRRRELPGRTLEDLCTGLLNKRLGQTLLRAAGLVPLTRPAESLTPREIDRLTAFVKGWELPVTGTQGMGGAQVTAGGISLQEVNPRSMESKIVKGLYITGEALDVDGDCGGYNLQWAWSSAVAAAAAAAGTRETGKRSRRTGRKETAT